MAESKFEKALQNAQHHLADLWSMRTNMTPADFQQKLEKFSARSLDLVVTAPDGQPHKMAEKFHDLVKQVVESNKATLESYSGSVDKHIKYLNAVFEAFRVRVTPKAKAAMYRASTMKNDRYTRLDRVTKLLASLEVVAAAEVHLKGTCEVYRDNDAKEDLKFDFKLPAGEDYAKFLDALHTKLDSLVGEEGYSMDLSTDVEFDGDKGPLRLWLEAQEPVNHEATALFYDWIEDQYRWYDFHGAKGLSKNNHGFAHTPYTWDYYKDDADLLNTYGDVFVDDDEMYDGEDDSGKPKPASDAQQAAHVWGAIENDSSNLETKQNELVSGDYFIIRYA